MTEFDDLPKEILEQIFGHLRGGSLNLARPTCRQWALAGARDLLYKIYFSSLPEAMNVFAGFTRNPHFASSVNELIYDARIFWHYVLNDAIYRIVYDDVHGYTKTYHQANRASEQADGRQDESELDYEVKLRKSRDRYEELHYAQIAALQKGRDYEVLSTGFGSFSNLEKTSVRKLCATFKLLCICPRRPYMARVINAKVARKLRSTDALVTVRPPPSHGVVRAYAGRRNTN